MGCSESDFRGCFRAVRTVLMLISDGIRGRTRDRFIRVTLRGYKKNKPHIKGS
jgi:hypothetical protein